MHEFYMHQHLADDEDDVAGRGAPADVGPRPRWRRGRRQKLSV
jgi:hypothetical protein